jgi:dTMP kinase
MAGKRGYFISIEGIEGVGKSTAVAHIKRYCEQRSIPLVATHEPGGTPIADAIRAMVLKDWDETLCDESELLLMFASRVQHVREVIQPALASGQWVLSDRFIDATYAYQGGGRGIDSAVIDSLVSCLGLKEVMPDKTILLDADYGTAFERLSSRGHYDRIEQEKKDFFDRVRAAYKSRVLNDMKRFTVIDANQSLFLVKENLDAQMHHWITQWDEEHV